jgi:hypothetical protein
LSGDHRGGITPEVEHARFHDAHPAAEGSMKVLKPLFFLLFGILLGTGL